MEGMDCFLSVIILKICIITVTIISNTILV